jgi:hypothetical protein
MAKSQRSSGTTLIEAMAAMAVLLIGAVGLVAVESVGARMNNEARVITRATGIAQDLAAQLQSLSYNDPLLSNETTDNDDKISDPDQPVDHSESELTSLTTFAGIPTSSLPLGFTRSWNVAEVDTDENGSSSGKRLAVIVKWSQGGNADNQTAAHSVVIVTFLNPPNNTN